MAGFKGYKRSIKLEFDYNEVKQGIPNVKKQMAVLNAEFKKSSEEANASGKSLDKLGVRYDYLGEKIKIQEKEVEAWRKKLEEAEKAQGNNAKAVQNATTSLEIAQAKLGQTKAELGKVTQELEKQKTTLGKTSDEWNKLSDKTTEAGKTLSTRVTLPIMGAAAASFKLGADMEDALGKTDVVFKRNSEAVKRWADDSLKSFGLAKVNALDMVTSFGGMAAGMGISNSKILEMSKSLTELTTDMATFHNKSIDVTRTALASVFTGETESLKQFGIVMTEANLQQFAYTQGIRKKVSEMTQAEKVQLRYSFLISQTKDATGNFKREQDGATAQMMLFKQGLTELGTSFSTHILPVLTPVLKGLNKMIEYFAGLNEGTKKIILTVGGVVAVAGPVLIMMGSVFKAISNISEGMKAAKGAIDLVKGAGKIFNGALTDTGFFGFAKWAVLIAAVALAIGYLIDKLNTFLGKGYQVNEFMGNMNELTGSINNAKIRGYAVGTNYIQQDQKAIVHEGEAIIPKESNPWNPNASTPFNFNGGGGDTFNLNVKMSDIDDVSKLVRLFNELKQTRRAGVVNGF